MYAGRWPVENKFELNTVIDKTIAYEQKSFSGNALIGYHDFSFPYTVSLGDINGTKQIIVDKIINDMTSDPNHGWTNIDEMFLTQYDYLNNTQEFTNKRDGFINKLSQGTDLLIYIGGGSSYSTNAGVGLLDTSDLGNIQNSSNPYVAILYDHSSANYLGEGENGWEEGEYFVSGAAGENLLVSPTSGAAAVLGMQMSFDFWTDFNEVNILTNTYNKPIGSIKEIHEPNNILLSRRRTLMTLLGDPSLVIKK